MEKDYTEKIIETEQRSKSNTKRLDEHDTEIKELQNTYKIMEKMDYRISNMENKQDKFDAKIDTLIEKQSEPVKEKGKKWDKLIDYLFYFFIAGMLALVAFKLGLK